jgi:hypothetical protein
LSILVHYTFNEANSLSNFSLIVALRLLLTLLILRGTWAANHLVQIAHSPLLEDVVEVKVLLPEAMWHGIGWQVHRVAGHSYWTTSSRLLFGISVVVGVCIVLFGS